MNEINTSQRGARPIISKKITAHYGEKHPNVTLEDYTKIWRDWINFSDNKNIIGLDKFSIAEYTHGTTQTFDQFALRNQGRVAACPGEFQYHKCIGKFTSITQKEQCLFPGDKEWAFIMSVPFSDTGSVHWQFKELMMHCEENERPVCLDFAYWGIAKDIVINLDHYPCVQEITFSLSKPFHTLETHRVGIRFSRKYADDGISMLNEVGMNNKHSMALGASYMKKFSPDWYWDTYSDRYFDVIDKEDLAPTNTVIFGMGDNARHGHLNRGIQDNYRVCISEQLGNSK